MIRYLSSILLCGVVFLSACSKRERSAPGDEDWADIQPFTGTTESPKPDAELANQQRRIVQSESEDYAPLIKRLQAMESIERQAGETMLTSESMVFDYERRFVRMEQDVKVVDDRGILEAESLMGRFSEENEVEIIEAHKGVKITSEGRQAVADNASYAFASGAVELSGNAQVSAEGNRLSAERIRFWIKGNRRMVCEPNALLEITQASGLKVEGLPEDGGTTEIRAARLVYDEEKALATLEDNVRLRDPRAAMNCDLVRVHLKENTEIDWIEARSEVIIQTEDRKALADRASYYADEGKFVLEGDPKLKQGPNIMTGERISFWLETERMVCEPNARVLLYPDEEMKAKFLKDLKD